MNLKNTYDVIVAGAGPAGLRAALAVLSAPSRPSVLLVDNKVPWENPIACAEAVGKFGFAEAIDPKPEWIRFLIRRASFHSPDNTSITYADSVKGYIINRAIMQRDIAAMCQELGADCHFGQNSAVVNVSPLSGGKRTVTFRDGASTTASVFIDASGPLSRLGSAEKIAWKAYDLEPAYFAVVKNVKAENDLVHIYVGQNVAPGGYAWSFPREENVANVGIVVGNKFAQVANIRTLLSDFVKKQFPEGQVSHYFAGPIPCGYKRVPISLPGLIKTGDAASTVNPLSRAGIVEAMLSGKIAGEYAIKMLGNDSEKKAKELCKQYENAWFQKRGNSHAKFARVKPLLQQVPDSDFDAGARALSKVPAGEMTMFKIFSLTVGRFSKLVWAMRHLL